MDSQTPISLFTIEMSPSSLPVVVPFMLLYSRHKLVSPSKNATKHWGSKLHRMVQWR